MERSRKFPKLVSAIRLIFWGLGFIAASDCWCQTSTARKQIVVSDAIWEQLSQSQRDIVSNGYIVELIGADAIARITYVQSIDESTAGNDAGSVAGSALAQARYVDKTNLQHYSATKQVTAGIAGALLGSLLNTPARQSYRFAYTLKKSDGSVVSTQKVSDNPIFVPPGTCVEISSLAFQNDNLCESTFPTEIDAILAAASSTPTEDKLPIGSQTAARHITTPTVAVNEKPENISAEAADQIVVCRLGPTSVTQTTAIKCKSAGGVVKN